MWDNVVPGTTDATSFTLAVSSPLLVNPRGFYCSFSVTASLTLRDATVSAAAGNAVLPRRSALTLLPEMQLQLPGKFMTNPPGLLTRDLCHCSKKKNDIDSYPEAKKEKRNGWRGCFLQCHHTHHTCQVASCNNWRRFSAAPFVYFLLFNSSGRNSLQAIMGAGSTRPPPPARNVPMLISGLDTALQGTGLVPSTPRHHQCPPAGATGDTVPDDGPSHESLAMFRIVVWPLT